MVVTAMYAMNVLHPVRLWRAHDKLAVRGTEMLPFVALGKSHRKSELAV